MDQSLIKQYVYNCQMTALFSDNTIENISDYLTHFAIEIDPSTRVFPLFNIKFQMKPDLILKVQKDSNIKFNLKIIKTDINNGITYENCLNTNLVPILNDITPLNLSDTLLKNDSEKEYQSEYFEMKLIPIECINSNKKIVSGVYIDTTIMNVIMLLSQKLDYKIFISPFDNYKVYKQIILIPNNIFVNLRYLNEVYGFYNNGLNTFYGFDIFRIYAKNYYNIKEGSNTIYINFPANDPDDNYQTGSYKKGLDNIIYATVTDLRMVSSKKLVQEVAGNNISNFSINDEFSSYKDNKKVKNKDFNKTKLMINNYNNEMRENEIINIINEQVDTQILLRNIDFNITDLFKIYRMKFISSLYNKTFDGNYIMNKTVLDFKKNTSNGVHIMNQLLMLKKI